MSMGLYLVMAEVKGAPPQASIDFIERGKGTLERLDELEKQGRAKGGIYSGRMGMCVVVDADSNEELNQLVISLPSFPTAQWEVIPLHSFAHDLEITNRVLEMMSQR
jgi:muconolactone D-isomerase